MSNPFLESAVLGLLDHVRIERVPIIPVPSLTPIAKVG